MTKKSPELRQLKHELELSAQRIFNLHNNPDHQHSDQDIDHLIEAELMVDAAIAALLKLT